MWPVEEKNIPDQLMPAVGQKSREINDISLRTIASGIPEKALDNQRGRDSCLVTRRKIPGMAYSRNIVPRFALYANLSTRPNSRKDRHQCLSEV